MSELDLHGVKHNEVKQLLDSFLWDNMKKNKKEVRVITGFSEQMKSIVKDLTNEYSMTCFEDYKNNGVLVIKLT
jgi:DNA-nicking Smr family endonuclease